MVLNNFWYAMRVAALNRPTVRNAPYAPACVLHGMTAMVPASQNRIYIGGVNGDFHNITTNNAITAMYNIYAPMNALTVCVGTGDTEVDANDWKLVNDITSILVNRSDSGVISDIGSEVSLTRVFSGQNPTNEDIVIKEVGLKKLFCCYTTPDNHAANDWTVNTEFLMAREVLDTPVIIPPNESRSIVVKLKLV